MRLTAAAAVVSKFYSVRIKAEADSGVEFPAADLEKRENNVCNVCAEKIRGGKFSKIQKPPKRRF